MKPTPEQISSYMNVVEAITEAIRTAGEIPSGHLYSVACGLIRLETYQRIIDLLVSAELVERRGHLLKWIGKQPKQQ